MIFVDQMCDKGEFLDVQGDQSCKKCPAGTYSLGGGIRFEDWDELPDGFQTSQEDFRSLFSNTNRNNTCET